MTVSIKIVCVLLLNLCLTLMGQENFRSLNNHNFKSPEKSGTLSISPNPSQCEFVINYKTEQTGPFTLKIFNATGQLILLRHYKYFSGELTEAIDLKEFPAGIYILQIAISRQTETRKLILE
jgi:hypothetical protein